MIDGKNIFKRRKTYLEDGARLIFWVRFAAFWVDYILLFGAKKFLLFLIALFISYSLGNLAWLSEENTLI